MRAACQQGNRERRAGVEQMLTIVQHQQYLTPADETGEIVSIVDGRPIFKTQSAGHGDRHSVGSTSAPVDKPDALAELARHSAAS